MRGYVGVLVIGLAVVIHGAEVSSGKSDAEQRENGYGSSINVEKAKRGAVKLSNADNPGFNHLTTTNGGSGSNGGGSSSSGSGGFKPILPPAITPFRYVQSNQFQPLYSTSYLQPHHSAAQIAGQYAFQGAPVAHYLQTPTHVQYVSTPAVAQFPLFKFPAFGGDYANDASVADTSASSSSTSTASSASSSSSSSASTAASSASSVPQHASTYSHQSLTSGSSPASHAKDYFLYQTPKPLYYTPQPFLTFFVQPQTPASTNFLYPHSGINYFYKHSQPHQYLSLTGGNRFGMYPTGHTGQLYLVPMTTMPAHGHDGLTGNELKSTPTKHASSGQVSSSTNSFAYGNKG